jgi:long-subunit fatty acid transport protein
MGDCLYNSLRHEAKVRWPRTATIASHTYFAAASAVVLALFVFVGTTCANSSVPPRGSAPEPYVASDTDNVQVLAVRSLSQVDSSQVFIDLSAEVRYKVGHLSNPERVYLDFPQTGVSPRLISRRIALQNGLIDQIRIGTSQGPVTRVVLDLASPVRYRVSKLDNPARMLIELSRPPEAAASSESIPPGTEALGQTPASAGSKTRGALPAGRAAPSLLKGGDAPADNPSGPQTYGGGEKAGLNYAGTPGVRNILSLGLTVGSSYDDNILGNNQQRVGDVDLLVGPSIRLHRDGRHLSAALGYQPYFRMYRNASIQNAADQILELDLTYHASSHLSFRGRGSAYYTTGIFQPNQNAEFVPELGSPSSLNQTVFTPTTRELTWNSRVDLNYQVNVRDSFDLFAGQAAVDFMHQVPNEGALQNTQQRTAGLVYQYRLSPHTTVGINYMVQDIRFWPESRTLVHSGFFTYAQQFSPSLTVSLFGGPQYTHLNDLVLLRFGPLTLRTPFDQTQWNWAVGSSLVKRENNTVFQFSALHQVSDGGGLIGGVSSSSVMASVRRQLTRTWDVAVSAGYAKNSSLGSAFSQGGYDSLTAEAGLEHSLTDKLSLRVGYDFLRQRSTGQSPSLGNFDRDLWSVQVSYSFHQIALRR